MAAVLNKLTIQSISRQITLATQTVITLYQNGKLNYFNTPICLGVSLKIKNFLYEWMKVRVSFY